MAVPIQHLTAEQPELVTISPSATLEEAVALMIEHDFSQLPVVENGKPFGKSASFVTGNSIVRALRTFGTSLRELHVRDAIVAARTIYADEDLFSKMDDLLDAYAVLILNLDDTIAGIVTNYDTTQYFRRRAEDMLLVEDIETTLKDHVRSAYGGDETGTGGPLKDAIAGLGSHVDTIRENCRKAFRKFCHTKNIEVSDEEVSDVVSRPFDSRKGDRRFDDLSLNEYIQLARKPEAWKVLAPVFSLPDKAFLEMMESVRDTRNKLMHFRPDITAVDRDQLRFCAQWFKNHPPVSIEVESLGLMPPDVGTSREDATGVTEPATGEYIGQSAAGGDSPPAESKGVESKYAPLARYLLDQSGNLERLTLGFAEIEEIIGAPLPAAAREHRAWWSNDETAHVQSAQWLNVNWRVVSINMTMEKVTFARARDRERAYIDFFSSVQNQLREHSDFPLFPANPLGINWLTLVKYEAGQRLILSFALRQRIRLELNIDTGDGDENNRIYGALLQRREYLETALGSPIEWEPLENRRSSRIALYTKGNINDDQEPLEKLQQWAVGNAVRFHGAIRDLLPRIVEQVKGVNTD